MEGPMADNPGAFPLDPTSPIGQFRLASGDTQSQPYEPVRPGLQNYTYLSDDEVALFLVQGQDATDTALGYWYLSLAGQAAMQSKSVKDYDLQIDLTKRAGDLRAQATFYFDRARQATSDAEFFDIVDTGRDHARHELEEGRWPYGI